MKNPSLLPRRSSRSLFVAGAAAAAAILSGPIQAATFVWDNGGGDFNWGNSLNWNPDGVPTVGDIATFSSTAAGIFGDIQLGGVDRSVQVINFTANTSTLHRLQNGSIIDLTDINQTADDSNEVQVTITTAGGGTGILTSNVTSNTLQLQRQITSGGLIKNGGSTLRLGTSGTNYINQINGDIVLNAGNLTASGGLADGSNNPLGGTGNVVITSSGRTLRLEFSNLAAAGNAGTFDFQRDIIANNNSFTLHVDRAAGSANGGISQAGMLTMGNATLTLNQGNSFQARLDGLTVNSGATAILTTNANLRLDSLVGDATTTIQKNAGNTLFISAADNTNFSGALLHNGSTIQIEGSAGNSPVANSSGLTFMSSATLNLRSNETLNFGLPIDFAPGIVTSTISVDRISAGTGQVLSMGALTIGGSGFPNNATRVLTINAGNSFTFATAGINIGADEVGALHTNTGGTVAALNLGADSVFEKRGGSTLIVTGDNSTTASGEIKVLAGALDATVAGSLGTGLVIVGDDVPNTAGFLPNASRVRFQAVGASANTTGVDIRAIAGGVIDLDVVPTATDVFEVRADGRIQGNGAQLQGLTVGSNLILAENAIIVHDQPGATAATVNNLANDASTFYGIAATANTLPTIGAGTPWKGVSSDNTARTIQGVDATNPAVININGGDNNNSTIEAYFQGMFNANLTFASNYTFATTAAGGEKVTLGIRGTLGAGFGNVPGALVILGSSAAASGLVDAVDKIIVTSGGLTLNSVNALGGVPVEVRSNGVLDIGNLAGDVIDGPVVIKDGGMFVFNDNQVLAGTGLITFESGAKLDLTGGAPATFFTTTTQPISVTGNNYTVRFAPSNMDNMDAVIPDDGVIYVISGGATAATVSQTNISATMNTQTAGLTLVNGVLTNDGTTRAFTGPLNLNNSNFTAAASRGTSLIITSDVTTTGNVQIGSATPIDNRDKTSNSAATNGFGIQDPFNSGAQVIFTGAFAGNNVTAERTHLAFTNANTTISGALTVNGGILYLDAGGPVVAPLGELTPKLLNGSLADEIVLGTNSRIEMGILEAGAGVRQEINQPFVIAGNVNPLDKRSFWVSRSSGSVTLGVNFNDITLMPGGVFHAQESNTDVRASLKVAGDSHIINGAGGTNWDLINVTRHASLPAFDGTNPVVVTQGRVNVFGEAGESNLNSFVFGEIGAGVQIDIVRGQLFFTPGSAINGVIRTQTAAVGGDSFVTSQSNSTSNTFITDTTIGGTGRVELGRSAAANGPEDFEIRGTEVTNAAAAQAPLHTHTGEIRVINDGTDAIDGIIRSNRMNDSDRTARVRVDNVVLTPNSTVQLASSNGIPLTVGGVTLQGNGTIDTAAGGMTIETVTAGSNTVSFTGGSAPTVVNALTAGGVNSRSVNFSGPVTATANVNVADGITSFAADVTAAQVNVTSGTGNFSGDIAAGQVNLAGSTANINGAGAVGSSINVGTSALNFNTGAGNTRTIGGPINLNLGTMSVASGTVDLGTNAITSNTSEIVMAAGLREMLTTGSFNETTPNTSNALKLGPVMAQTTAGWFDNTTYVYTGQFLVPDNNGDGTGTFAFAENFDDSVRVDIDGIQRLRNTVWNDASGTGALTLPAGWHDIELRFGQGGGGAGPNNSDGWNLNLGFGLDMTIPVDSSTGSPAQANFVAPLDDGSMNLFRSSVSTELAVGANATVKAGAITDVGTILFSAANGRVELSGAGTSSAREINVSTGGSATLVAAQASANVNVANLNLDGALTKEGAGRLTVSGTGSGTGAVNLDEGSLVLLANSSIAGSVTTGVNTEVGGSGAIGGTLTAGGVVSPGLSPGRLTVGTFDLLNTGTLRLELGGTTAGTDYDQIFLPAAGAGDVMLAGILEATATGPLSLGQTFVIIQNSGTGNVFGTFSNAPENGWVMLGGQPYEVNYGYEADGDSRGNDVALTVVPEPGSLATLLAGAGVLMGLQRFRRRVRI